MTFCSSTLWAWFSSIRRSYSRSTPSSGLTNTTPDTPSTIRGSPVLITRAALETPVTAGMRIDRAKMEVCENLPPRSVTKARTRSSSRAVADGESSSATRIDPLRNIESLGPALLDQRGEDPAANVADVCGPLAKIHIGQSGRRRG